MFAKLLFFSFFCLFVLSIDADPKDYPKILAYGIQEADKKAADNDIPIRYFKTLSFSLSDTGTGKQYHTTLLYLSREGYQFFFEMTIYENPWGELTMMDIEQSSRLLSEAVPLSFLP